MVVRLSPFQNIVALFPGTAGWTFAIGCTCGISIGWSGVGGEAEFAYAGSAPHDAYGQFLPLMNIHDGYGNDLPPDDWTPSNEAAFYGSMAGWPTNQQAASDADEVLWFGPSSLSGFTLSAPLEGYNTRTHQPTSYGDFSADWGSCVFTVMGNPAPFGDPGDVWTAKRAFHHFPSSQGESSAAFILEFEKGSE